MTCQQVATGFKCEKDKPITISSPDDANNPLTSHQWIIDGAVESTAPQFQKTYPNGGVHTVIHSGSNPCGGTCTQTATLEIVNTIIPTTPPESTTASPSKVPILIVSVLTLGLLGIMISKRK
jgi:hypothetical protein